MGNRAGTMSLCIPYNVIEPIMGVLAAQNWFSYHRKGLQDDHLRKLTKNINNAPVEMRAILAQTTIRLNDLMSLQPGDIITTDKECDRDVLLQVEGRNKPPRQVGRFRGSRAVRITRVWRAGCKWPSRIRTKRPEDAMTARARAGTSAQIAGRGEHRGPPGVLPAIAIAAGPVCSSCCR